MTTPAALPSELPLAVSTAPERIWLQIGDDADYMNEPFPIQDSDLVTWCQDSVVNAEVKYVRYDIHKAALADSERTVAELRAINVRDNTYLTQQETHWRNRAEAAEAELARVRSTDVKVKRADYFAARAKK